MAKDTCLHSPTGVQYKH